MIFKEVKVQIIVKSKNIKTSIAKIQNIEPVNLVIKKINSIKNFIKKVKSNDYIILYNAANARRPLNELEDNLDFQEFICKYKRIVLAGKKMLIIVIVKDSLTKKKKSHNKVYFLQYIVYYSKTNF